MSTHLPNSAPQPITPSKDQMSELIVGPDFRSSYFETPVIQTDDWVESRPSSDEASWLQAIAAPESTSNTRSLRLLGAGGAMIVGGVMLLSSAGENVKDFTYVIGALGFATTIGQLCMKANIRTMARLILPNASEETQD